MANDKDFILKNAVEVGGSTKVTVGDAPTVGSVAVGYADASTWSYDSINFYLFNQDVTPNAVAFNNDGTKMYMVGASDSVFQYTLSTAFDVSTASYDSVSFSVTSQDTSPKEIRFKDDGTKMYMVGSNDIVFQYSLSTAFDLSTASYDSVSFSVNSQSTDTTGLVFKPDGTKLYVVDWVSDTIYQYSLSTAFDISTTSYDNVSLNASARDGAGRSVAFNGDGTKMYYLGSNNKSIYQYTLSTAYVLSTASYDSVVFSVSSEDFTPVSLVFNSDGTKMYITGATGDKVYQYSTGSTTVTNVFDLSTGNYFATTPSASAQYDFSNAGDTQTWQLEVTGNQVVVGYDLAIAAYDSVSFFINEDNLPIGLRFNNDGTKLYVLGNGNRTVYQYTLSTAFDLSTASYDSVSFSVASQDSVPYGIVFSPDGTTMYMVGATTDSIYQYSFSTAFDLSTASYDSVSFSVTSQDTAPLGVAFNNDGTKMYMVGATNDSIYQYSLSTAFDLSTASYDSVSFSVTSQDASPHEIVFNTDGTKMYMIGSTNDSIFQYTLSTAFDLSTASYDSVSFSISSQDTAPAGLAFNNDGTKLYMVGYSNDRISQYTTSTATPITITWDADIQWAGGTAPDSPANGEKDLYTITTDDAGTSYVGNQSGDNFS